MRNWCQKSEIFRVILSNHHVWWWHLSHTIMTSFNYDGKKKRDVGPTWICHLNNIMPDSVSRDSMGLGVTCFLTEVVITIVFPGIK